VIMPGYVRDPADTLVSAAIHAANRALSLDSTLVDAKIALAHSHSARLQLTEAEALYSAVIRYGPQNATARQWHGVNLLALGRFDDAITELRRATALDPLSAVVQSNLAYALWIATRIDEALSAARRVFDIDPNFSDPPLLSTYVFGGQPDSALYYLRRMQRADSTALYLRGMFAVAFAASQRWAEYDSIRAVAARVPDSTSPLDAALIALAGGDERWMTRFISTAAGQREFTGAFLRGKRAPFVSPLRRDSSLAPFVGSNCLAVEWPIKPRSR